MGNEGSAEGTGHHFLCPVSNPENTSTPSSPIVCECELIDRVYQHSAQVLAGYVLEKTIDSYNKALQDVRDAVSAMYMQTKPWNSLTVADVIHVIDMVGERHNG